MDGSYPQYNMQDFYIDTLATNLQIHSSNNSINIWLQSPIEGLDMPDIRATEYDKPGEDGRIVSAQQYGGRTIVLRGIFQASTPQQVEELRQSIMTATAIKKNNAGQPQPTRCEFTTLSGARYFFDSYITRKPVFNWDQILWGNFLIVLSVPHPFIKSTTSITSGIITQPSGGGFVLPVVLPITSSAASGGTATLVNTGNAIAYPIITLSGAITNPFIRNTSTNKTMRLNYTMGVNDTVVIDMLEHIITLNSAAPLISSKESDAVFWGLRPGSNVIKFSGSSSSDTGTMQISFNASYLGV